jgi:outer membrane protein assembly factor BamB
MFRHDAENSGTSTVNIPDVVSPLWSFDTKEHNSQYTGTCTAAIADGIAYFGEGSKIFAVDASSGAQIWNNSLGGLDHYASPAVGESLAYFHCSNGKLYAVWKSNGTEKWNVSGLSSGDRAYESPILVNDSVFVVSSTIFAINATTGIIIWQKFSGGTLTASTPAYRDNVLYYGTGSSYTVRAVRADNGNLLWETGTLASQTFSSPGLGSDRLFISTYVPCNLYALGLSDGHILWNQSTGIADSSPAVSDDKVYLPGRAYAQATGNLIWDKNTGASETSAIISGNRMLCVNGTKLASLDKDTGSIIWEEEAHVSNGLYAGSPSITDGIVLIGGKDGVRRAFGAVGSDVIPPRVLSTNPSNNSLGVPVNAKIEVTFSEPMNTTSTEYAFSIIPPVSGSFGWSGTQMTFTPDILLDNFTSYEVVIASTAKDNAGNALDGNGNGTSDGSPTDDCLFGFETGNSLVPEISAAGASISLAGIIAVFFIAVRYGSGRNETYDCG